MVPRSSANRIGFIPNHTILTRHMRASLDEPRLQMEHELQIRIALNRRHFGDCIQRDLKDWAEARKSVVKVHFRFSAIPTSKWGALRIYVDLIPVELYGSNPPDGFLHTQPRDVRGKKVCDHQRLHLCPLVSYRVADSIRSILHRDPHFTSRVREWVETCKGNPNYEYHLFLYHPFHSI